MEDILHNSRALLLGDNHNTGSRNSRGINQAAINSQQGDTSKVGTGSSSHPMAPLMAHLPWVM